MRTDTLELAERFFREGSPGLEHGRAVGKLAGWIGTRLGIAGDALGRLRLAGLLHDVGKLEVPREILEKPGPLDPVEWSVVRRHPAIGADMLRAEGMDDLAPVVRSHHERVDGLGYPDALHGREIPFESRILAVADAYDAMVNPRPYRPALSAQEAREELQHAAGRQFDPIVVAAFLAGAGTEIAATEAR